MQSMLDIRHLDPRSKLDSNQLLWLTVREIVYSASVTFKTDSPMILSMGLKTKSSQVKKMPDVLSDTLKVRMKVRS